MSRPTRKKLIELVKEAQKRHAGPCDGEVFCSLMSAVLTAHEGTKRPAFEMVPMFDATTGRQLAESLVYFVRQAEYAVVGYCPFCGAKYERKKIAAAKARLGEQK